METKSYCWSEDSQNIRCAEQCSDCKEDILNTIKTETTNQLTFGEIKNSSPFLTLDNQELFKMGSYGIGVDYNGSVFKKFSDKDPVKEQK